MTPATFLFKGMLIGFSIAAPVGPIGILCIRRSLAHGRLIGLMTGLGAATADAAYGAIAAFGLTAISTFLVNQRSWLALVGGVFLCYLGVRTFTSKPIVSGNETREHDLYGAYASTLFLTLTNPMTILSFVAIFAGLGLGASPTYATATAMVIGVFIGSALWWLLLSNGVALLRRKVDETWMKTINRISGAMIFSFGVFGIVTAHQ